MSNDTFASPSSQINRWISTGGPAVLGGMWCVYVWGHFAWTADPCRVTSLGDWVLAWVSLGGGHHQCKSGCRWESCLPPAVWLAEKCVCRASKWKRREEDQRWRGPAVWAPTTVSFSVRGHSHPQEPWLELSQNHGTSSFLCGEMLNSTPVVSLTMCQLCGLGATSVHKSPADF